MSVPVETLISSCTDWRINILDPSQSVVFPGPKIVDATLLRHAQRLADEIKKHFDGRSQDKRCLIEFDSYRYRVQQVRPHLYAARTLRLHPLLLPELGFTKEVEGLLLSEDLQRTGGLVIIFGSTGAGKTTTISGTVVSRLQKLGGYCLCVEDPPENILEGFHGTSGYAEQMDASDIGYERALFEALRCFPSGKPSMLMLGEIRSREDAAELLQIALNGHLVFTTMHAKDIISGLSRLVSLASNGDEKEAKMLLANGLSLVVHQSLANNTPQMTTLKLNHTASAIVQNGAMHQLQDEILKQNRFLRPNF